MKKKDSGSGSAIFWGVGIACAAWMFAPYLLGMDAVQTHKWANASLADAPGILDEWYMDKTHTGRVTVTDGGKKTTYTSRDGAWGATGKPPEGTVFTVRPHDGDWAAVYDTRGNPLATGELTENSIYNAAGNRWTVTIEGRTFENIPDERVRFFSVNE